MKYVKRLLGCPILAVLAGCQTPAAPFDPFLAGRTTIPPPGTAVPAGAAPYYNATPPVVSVPGATIYAPPGAAAAPVPPSSLPPATSPRFPRGITLPQSNTQTGRQAADLAGWQPADSGPLAKAATPQSDSEPSTESRVATTVTASPNTSFPVKSNSTSAVVQASHTEPASEPPLRIVEPASRPDR